MVTAVILNLGTSAGEGVICIQYTNIGTAVLVSPSTFQTLRFNFDISTLVPKFSTTV